MAQIIIIIIIIIELLQLFSLENFFWAQQNSFSFSWCSRSFRGGGWGWYEWLQ